jgi:hypothetical protein
MEPGPLQCQPFRHIAPFAPAEASGTDSVRRKAAFGRLPEKGAISFVIICRVGRITKRRLLSSGWLLSERLAHGPPMAKLYQPPEIVTIRVLLEIPFTETCKG